MAKKTEYCSHLGKFGNRNSFSKTDTDATFMHMKEDYMRNGQLKPGYNIQIGVESEYIVGVGSFSNRSDVGTLIPFLNRIRKHTNRKFENIIADAGYESSENYLYLEENEQNCFIKPQNYEISKKRIPLTVLESVSEASWISASVSPDSRPPGLWSGPGLSQVLWLWLRSSRRPAVSHGVGACECVCLSVCLPVVRLLSQEGRVLGGRRGDKGGASVGQRGGAEALRSTAPPWLPVGLGSGQVPGKLGAQDSLRLGPQEVQRPPGRGDREAAGP